MPPLTRSNQQKASKPEPLDPLENTASDPTQGALSEEKVTKPVAAPLYLLPLVFLIALLSMVYTAASSVLGMVFYPFRCAAASKKNQKQQ